MTFAQLGLEAQLLKGVEAAGFETPTPIQIKAIPPALTGRDIVGSAQTGTGKTAAFALPILQRLGSHGALRSLILVPTRELAVQVEETFAQLGSFSDLKTMAVYGGVALGPQTDAMRSGLDIIVATPGRLLDHLERRHLTLDNIEIFVLDEADRMLDMGFAPDINRILKRIPKQRQSMLFSATIPPAIERLASRTLVEPIKLEAAINTAPAEGITEVLYRILASEKASLLLALLDSLTLGPTLIFCRTRRGADRISMILQQKKYRVATMHADRTQAQRGQALEGFRDGSFDILVATDIAARGLDVTGITHVINYDVPEYAEDYVHRVGRTARASAVGDAITFVDPWEESFIAAIEKFTGRSIPNERLPENYMSYEVPPPPPRRREGYSGSRPGHASAGSRGGHGSGRGHRPSGR